MAKKETGETEELDDVETDESDAPSREEVKSWIAEAISEALTGSSSEEEDEDDDDDDKGSTSSLSLKDIEEATRRAVASAMKEIRPAAKKAAPKKAAPKKEPEVAPDEPGKKSWTARLWGTDD